MLSEQPLSDDCKIASLCLLLAAVYPTAFIRFLFASKVLAVINFLLETKDKETTFPYFLNMQLVLYRVRHLTFSTCAFSVNGNT